MQILPVAEAVLNDPGAGRLDPGFHLHDEHLRTIKRDPHVMRFKSQRKIPTGLNRQLTVLLFCSKLLMMRKRRNVFWSEPPTKLDCMPEVFTVWTEAFFRSFG